MDDQLEEPRFAEKPLPTNEQPDHEDEGSDDEDEGPDWTKLPTIARPVIPKRGEKDFEPRTQGGSGLQKHALDRARAAMFDAVNVDRTTSVKSMSYAIWYPSIARAHVTTARGIHFTNMGHSVNREVSSSKETSPQRATKRLELLPEEALYLIERGTMFCWKTSGLPLPDDMEGEPMSVQQAFAEMVGTQDLTLEKYHVFAYLRRLGYIVTRTKPPSPAYPAAAPFSSMLLPTERHHSLSLLEKLFARILVVVASIARPLILKSRTIDWWRPISLHHCRSYLSLYSSLRFLPYGYGSTLHLQKPAKSSPYEIFYNLYKPTTAFKKTAPPEPDFSVVVIDARKTPVPTLSELSALFDQVPYLPPPVPRRRMPYTQAGNTKPAAQDPSTKQPITRQPIRTLWTRIHDLLWRVLAFFQLRPRPLGTQAGSQPRKVNPFAVLKAGKKMVVIAVVDAGMISFFRFGQGAFEDFPMN